MINCNSYGYIEDMVNSNSFSKLIDETLNTYSHMFRSVLDNVVDTINKLDNKQLRNYAFFEKNITRDIGVILIFIRRNRAQLSSFYKKKEYRSHDFLRIFIKILDIY